MEGKLDTRGDAEKFPGGWGQLVGGVNDLMDAFVGPINVTAEYVDRISKGDIPEPITDAYKGDFNEIKNNLNQCIDVMKGSAAGNGPPDRRRWKASWTRAETRRSSPAAGASWWAA